MPQSPRAPRLVMHAAARDYAAILSPNFATSDEIFILRFAVLLCCVNYTIFIGGRRRRLPDKEDISSRFCRSIEDARADDGAYRASA